MTSTALLTGKACIVSGVGPGLGKEIALAFARQGADVALGARTESVLADVQAEIESLGQRAVYAPTDVTDPAQCERLVQTAHDAFGRVDVLVNNAFGLDPFEPFESVDLDKWRAVVEVTLFGGLELTKCVAPIMKEQRGGSIVFVNSMLIRKILASQGGYTVAKGALVTAAHVLAKELGPDKIRVNSIVPGWMWGPNVEAYLQILAQQSGRSVQSHYDEVAAQIPLGRIPTDEECADAAVFFASDLSSVITGQSLDVNGGEVFH